MEAAPEAANSSAERVICEDGTPLNRDFSFLASGKPV